MVSFAAGLAFAQQSSEAKGEIEKLPLDSPVRHFAQKLLLELQQRAEANPSESYEGELRILASTTVFGQRVVDALAELPLKSRSRAFLEEALYKILERADASPNLSFEEELRGLEDVLTEIASWAVNSES